MKTPAQVTMPMPRGEPHGGHMVTLKPTLPVDPQAWQPQMVTRPITVFGQFVEALKQRARMRIERTTARVAIPVMRTITEQAKVATEYQKSLDTLYFAGLEREIRVAELEQKQIELAAQRRQYQQLESMRLRKERFSLLSEIATLQRQIRDQHRPPEAKLSPAQQKVVKRTEIDEEIRELRTNEATAQRRATTEPEKRRLQNIYANRRDRLMEQLQQYL